MQHKRLCIITDDFDVGGVQRKIVDMVNFASKDKELSSIEIHIIVKYAQPYFLGNFIQNSHCFIHRFSKFMERRLGFSYFIYLCYWMIVMRPSHVLILLPHQLNYFVFIKPLLWWMPFKLIVSLDVILSSLNNSGYSTTYPNWWIHYMFNFADLIIAQTSYNKCDLVFTYGVDANKISIISNWVTFFPKNTKNDFYDIIYCGRIAKEKRLDRIIQIIDNVKNVIPSMRACIIGSGEESVHLHTYIKKYNLQNTVEIHPLTNNVKKYLCRAKILILASEYENFPMVILEAMTSGAIPIVLTFPGVEEFIVYGKNGFYENTQRKLTNQIITIIQHRYMRYRVRNQAQKMVYNYGPQLIRKTFETIFSNE